MALGEWNDGAAARALNRYCLKNTAGDLNTTGRVTGFVPCYASVAAGSSRHACHNSVFRILILSILMNSLLNWGIYYILYEINLSA